MTIMFLKMYTLNNKKSTLIALISLLFMVNLLLVTHVHYFVDIVGGLVYSSWCFWMVGKMVKWTDWVLSLPDLVVGWVCGQFCLKELV